MEYAIVQDLLKESGPTAWAQRMAGSHSPYDVISVDRQNKVIKFVQAKTKLVNEAKPTIDTETDITFEWRVEFYKRIKFIKRRG